MKSYMLEEYDTGEKDDDGNRENCPRVLWDANAFEKVDDKTVRLNLKLPQVAIPEHLCSTIPMRSSIRRRAVSSGLGSNGTGPFELAELEVGVKAVLKAHKGYWGPKVPNLDDPA